MMYLLAIGFWILAVSFLLYGAFGFISSESRKLLYPVMAMTLEFGMLFGAVLCISWASFIISSIKVTI